MFLMRNSHCLRFFIAIAIYSSEHDNVDNKVVCDKTLFIGFHCTTEDDEYVAEVHVSTK